MCVAISPGRVLASPTGYSAFFFKHPDSIPKLVGALENESKNESVVINMAATKAIKDRVGSHGEVQDGSDREGQVEKLKKSNQKVKTLKQKVKTIQS